MHYLWQSKPTGWTSHVALLVRNLPAMAGDVRDTGSTPEEGMATYSSILAWRIPMERRALWATVHSITESDMTEAT